MKETKHRSTRWALGAWALVLAAALLLAGCGGAAAPAAPASSGAASQSTPGAAALAAQTDRITDQFALEKNVSGVWGGRKRCSAFPSMCPSWNATARMP